MVLTIVSVTVGLIPIVLFLRLMHVGTIIICLLIMPYVLLIVTYLVRPNWVKRMMLVVDRELERVGEGLEDALPRDFLKP